MRRKERSEKNKCLAHKIPYSPLLIPFVLYASVKTGELVLGHKVNLDFTKLLSVETLNNLYVYYVGATVLSIVAGLVGYILTWILLKVFGYKPTVNEPKS